MTTTKSPTGIQTRTVAYESFMGLDSSRDVTALDTGKNQYLVQVLNGFCDWRGQIVRDPGASYVAGHSNMPVRHVAFYAPGRFVWATEDSAFISLNTDVGVSLERGFLKGSIVNSTVFNRKAHFFSANQQSLYFDGADFRLNQSQALNALRPAFGAVCGRRLGVAGIPGYETQVHFSRVDNHEVFPDDESPSATSVLRASYIDIANVTGTAEQVTGLARFEQSKLAVFTSDRTLIYTIDPDVTLWTLEERVSINVGCVAHATVQVAGEDILFCSRSGVYALRRSSTNGITITSSILSDTIDILYRELLNSCDDPARMSAVYDQDMGQYHIFFPQPGGVLCKRLTLTIKSSDGNTDSPQVPPKWSTGDFLNTNCAAFSAGNLLLGTSDGIYAAHKIESAGAEVYPDLIVTTPMLWHGSLSEKKSTHSIIIQAYGDADITLEVVNDEGVKIWSDQLQASDSPDDNKFPDVPLSRQYERKFECRYRGAQFRLTCKGKGLFRVVGFAVVVRKE